MGVFELNVSLKSAFLQGQINAIPSKSYAHRIAICNFFANNPIENSSQYFSKDILATIECLKNLKNGKTDLDCGESGSTLRFLLPVCAVLGGKFTFKGQGKLLQRPNQELFNLFEKHGLSVKQDDKIYLEGCLKAGEFEIRGDISSQYISGLLMALPNLKADSKIILTSPLVSAPYVDVTIEVLKNYGVNIEKTDYGFLVKGNQKFNGNMQAEGDWSNMAFFLVAGAINGKVTVGNLNLQSAQGDKCIVDILKLANANVQVEDAKVTTQKSEIKPFSVDCENCPDLVPILSVLASFANGESTLKNIQRLKIKESDRIESTIQTLKEFGIKATSNGVDLRIYGKGQNQIKTEGAKVNSYNDHRIVMSASILALNAQNESLILQAEAVNKSYPTFFEDYNSLGGKANAI